MSKKIPEEEKGESHTVRNILLGLVIIVVLIVLVGMSGVFNSSPETVNMNGHTVIIPDGYSVRGDFDNGTILQLNTPYGDVIQVQQIDSINDYDPEFADNYTVEDYNGTGIMSSSAAIQSDIVAGTNSDSSSFV